MRRIFFGCIFLTSMSIFAHINYSPDFDMALGRSDPYFHRFYKQFIFSAQAPLSQLIEFCRQLYKKNNLKMVRVSKAPRIPLIIHQIWLGSPFPEKYKRWQKTWQSMPGWKYKLWTDIDIEKLNLVNKDLYLKSRNYGQRSDIARMEILNRYGGLYVDVDFECLNGDFFTLLHKTYDFYAGLEPLDLRKFSVNNALLASCPNHPLLKAYIKNLPKRWSISNRDKVLETVQKTGPAFITELFAKYGDRNGNRDIIFPPTFFYPLGFSQARFLHFPPAHILKIQVFKPESVAIHWWAGSWRLPSGRVR